MSRALSYNALTGRYQIEGAIDGCSTLIAISTVGENIIDIEFAKKANVPAGPAFDTFADPHPQPHH